MIRSDTKHIDNWLHIIIYRLWTKKSKEERIKDKILKEWRIMEETNIEKWKIAKSNYRIYTENTTFPRWFNEIWLSLGSKFKKEYIWSLITYEYESTKVTSCFVSLCTCVLPAEINNDL